MAARAMWKGVIRFGEIRVPVKLYAAVQDRSVHFRLLHAKDQAPVKQVLMNPQSGDRVEYRDARRAFVTPEGTLVMLTEDELNATQPQPSRTIDILAFYPPAEIDHRLYLRPYYLGPDEGGADAYFALLRALQQGGREGLAHWVMRNKEYLGALRLHAGALMLISLRHAEEVVAVEALDVPAGTALDEREVAMARQLMSMLAGSFEPEQYRDAYRARVESLIQAKASGGKISTLPVRKRQPVEDLASALQASLQQERKRA